MKCPECSTVNRSRDGMSCTQCHYRFVFNPQENDLKLTDNKFQAIRRSASGNDNYYFTPNQLYIAALKLFNKYTIPKRIGFIVLGIVITAIVVIGVGGNHIPAFPPLIFLFVVYLILWFASGSKTFLRSKWDAQVNKWKASGKQLDRLIEKPSLHTPPPEWKESDIYDYGAEGILICDRDIYVDFFVMNKFHTDQKLLILSSKGYPEYLVDKANELLDSRPDLPVYLIHDSTSDKKKMTRLLKHGAQLNVKNHPIHDLGLFDEDIQNIRYLKLLNPGTSKKVTLDSFLPNPLIHGLAQSVMTGMLLGAAIHDALAQGKNWDRDSGSGG